MLATAASASGTAASVTLLSRIAATHPHITKARADARCRTIAIDHGARHGGVDVHPVQRPPGARGFTIIPRRWTIKRSIGSSCTTDASPATTRHTRTGPKP
ncbi:hypothetical protein [Streptomyces sp900105755]|uniref:Uncharacterized protein n=1 Tax=Streptomyces sp. 900105755 TaxID=3154389 RepID=A0ABV1TR68_9ACTN